MAQTFCCLLQLFAPIAFTLICARTAADATLVGAQPHVLDPCAIFQQ